MILLLTCLFVLVCYKWGDWRNWKTYYATILFLIAGDFIYYYVAGAKPLWQYTSKLFPGTITTLIISLIIYLCTVLSEIRFDKESLLHHGLGLPLCFLRVSCA